MSKITEVLSKSKTTYLPWLVFSSITAWMRARVAGAQLPVMSWVASGL